jgi:transposase
VCCARVPEEGRPGRRLPVVEACATMTRSLLGMADHLACRGVTRVVMEATSDYWKPVLPAGSGRVRDVAGERQGRQAPAGRPKTGKLDALWLCKIDQVRVMFRS